jgi:hypothetical protein
MSFDESATRGHHHPPAVAALALAARRKIGENQPAPDRDRFAQ